jgi:poly(3-hydroxybutyrate) depolymerase
MLHPLPILVLLTAVCIVQPSAPDDPAVVPVVRGEAEHLAHRHGSYVRYVPAGAVHGVIVLAHGSIGENESAIQAARTFLGRWTAFADQEQIVLLAPAFDQQNFGGHAGPGGGYRGLFGRHVGADAFVNAIVDETHEAIPDLPETFALYGHSAGGQFVSRYLVMHPERITAAVISAAGTFAFPNPDVAWTNGMKPLQRRIRWSDDEPWEEIEIAPDAKGWVRAAQIPVTVVVGSHDTAEIKSIPGNPGRSHVERAQAWVQAMIDLAREYGETPHVQYVEVADVAHDSAKLTPACQRALRERLAELQTESDDDG